MPKNWTILPFFRWFWLLLKGFLVGSCFISFLIFKRLLQSNMRRLLLPSWVGSSSTVDEHCSFIQSAFIQLLVIILCSGLLWSSALHQFNGKWIIDTPPDLSLNPPCPICGEKPKFESNVTLFQFRRNASARGWPPAILSRYYIWYSELFDIVNKKVLTDLFVISRFECIWLNGKMSYKKYFQKIM